MTTLEERQAARREANLVASTLIGGVTVYRQGCKQCGKTFVCNEPGMILCSDKCLSAFLYDRGIVWYPEATPEERWEGDPQAFILPETLTSLKLWAERILQL